MPGEGIRLVQELQRNDGFFGETKVQVKKKSVLCVNYDFIGNFNASIKLLTRIFVQRNSSKAIENLLTVAIVKFVLGHFYSVLLSLSFSPSPTKPQQQ